MTDQIVFREAAIEYVREMMRPSRPIEWQQLNMTVRSDERDLLDELTKRLGWTNRKTVVVALSALDLMTSMDSMRVRVENLDLCDEERDG